VDGVDATIGDYRMLQFDRSTITVARSHKRSDIQGNLEISGLTKTIEMFLRGLKVLHLNNEQGLC
jgi:hypothetical protein